MLNKLGGAGVQVLRWSGAVILPEVCESFIQLRKLLHGQLSLAVSFLQLLRLRLQLLSGLQNILGTKRRVKKNIKILRMTQRKSHLNTRN